MVVCALLEQEGQVLAAQRSREMAHPLLWEFPGGKKEPGETLEEALHREIREELGLDIQITHALPAFPFQYPDGPPLLLYPFCCRPAGTSSPVARQHASLQWLAPTALPLLSWVAADVAILDYYLNHCLNREAH